MTTIAGVELGGTKCVCVLSHDGATIAEERRIPTTDPETTMAAIEDVLDGWQGFEAIGIASFGPIGIDPGAASFGFVTSTTKPGWANTDVAGRLLDRYRVPVGFHSDVVGAGLAEGQWGAAKGLRDHAYVTVGTGIGIGLISGDKPVVGLTHQELGHIRPVRMAGDDWPGMCSFHGDCVEGLASGPAIKARAGVSADQIAEDSPIWPLIAHPLAQLCHTLVLTGVPRRIVFGGGVALGVPWLLPMVRRMLDASIGDYGDRSLLGELDDYIVPAALGGEAGPLGAILLGQQALGD
ncbi:ROK family protein [Sphingomonas panacisoli]|uniref:fructokinase n=1 Tax=Sphingomonas panacisoli TaxID=1813879 RepID=A0A5B8LIR2_9SPHN|nr:ROK family protein [Sphingomonas panacisoli]QDZ08063.1 ROK family protein [Sphingomonas panacisoli]